MRDKISIAIDGPANAGKSTLAREVAKRLNIAFLDTGAMYRALALKVLRAGLDPGKFEDVEPFLAGTVVSAFQEADGMHVELDGENVSGQIRTDEVSKGASDIAVFPAVRDKLVLMQRNIAREKDIVMDGRDIGTNVLPKATYKFFLTASSRVRAERRRKDLAAMGIIKSVEELEATIIERDRVDSTREYAPLKQAEDAVTIDTTSMTVEEVLAAMLKIIQKGMTLAE